MAKTTKSYGTWVKGPEPTPIHLMIDLCLESLRINGQPIPPDTFGATKFSVSYIFRPPLSEEDPNYIPGEINDSGFTAVKITYEAEESDEREEESSSAA